MITGTTLINHSIRAELGLSLQEYVVMDYINLCLNNKENIKEKSVQYIAIEYENIIIYINQLHKKGLLHDNLPTDKWLNCFKKTKTKKIKNEFIPPTKEEVISYFKEKGYSDIQAKKAFEYYSVADWKDRNGDKVINWKQKMIANWMKEEHKITNQTNALSFQSKTYTR